MTDMARIGAEENAVARMPALGYYRMHLLPADLNSELEANLLFSCGGYVQFRDSQGRLMGEVSASSVTVAAGGSLTYERGTGPIGDCTAIWTGAAAIAHTHECAHGFGHAQVADYPHECACGATLPI